MLVARPVPVDVTLIQDDVLASSHQIQVVRLGRREVVKSHHHLLLVVLVFIPIFVLITFRGWRRGPTL